MNLTGTGINGFELRLKGGFMRDGLPADTL